MIELSKHIEHLLLENDCVIIPELGGFIAYYQPAHYEEDEGVFYPPMRTVGFNPQLTMNDGLLVQSYMQAYHTDYPDATRKIESTVNKLKDQLYKEGTVLIHGIGTLHYNIYGHYAFTPAESGILSPALYGLDCFAMPLLSVYKAEAPVTPQDVPSPAKPKKEYRLTGSWIGHAAAIAIAFILFFSLSTPVDNTYIDKGNYASLGTECLFDAIRPHSMATTLTDRAETEKAPQTRKTKEIKPVAVKVEKVASAVPAPEAKPVEAPKPAKVAQPAKKTKPAPVPDKPAVSGKKYHLIVASLATSNDAQQMLKSYRQKGYAEASVVEGSGRYRISLCSYTDKSTAHHKLNELKQNEAFKSAWLLTSK